MTREVIAALSLWALSHSAGALGKTDLANCAAISEPAARLGCYDDMTKNFGAEQAISAQPPGSWEIEEQRSEVDGSRSLYLTVEAGALTFDQNNHPTRPSLWIRCAEDQMSLYVWWKLYLGVDEIDVSYRVDSLPLQTQSWTIANNNEFAGLWSEDSAIPLIRRLLDADQLLLQLSPYDQTTMGSSFEVAGLRQAIKPLRAACDW